MLPTLLQLAALIALPLFVVAVGTWHLSSECFRRELRWQEQRHRAQLDALRVEHIRRATKLFRQGMEVGAGLAGTAHLVRRPR